MILKINKKINYYNIYIKDISNFLKNEPNLNILNNEIYINNFEYNLSKNRFKMFGELWHKLKDTTKDKYREINDHDEYLNIVKKNNNNYVELYVDGSYKKTKEIYSYAFIIVKNMNILHKRYGAKKEPKGSKIEHIAGELKAVIEGIRYIKYKKYINIKIYYDFKGIADLALLLNCKGRNDTTKKYQNFIRENMEILNIIFIKVKSHSGNYFNDEVDKLCKKAFYKNN
jgi:ribonuclease HI